MRSFGDAVHFLKAGLELANRQLAEGIEHVETFLTRACKRLADSAFGSLGYDPVTNTVNLANGSRHSVTASFLKDCSDAVAARAASAALKALADDPDVVIDDAFWVSEKTPKFPRCTVNVCSTSDLLTCPC